MHPSRRRKKRPNYGIRTAEVIRGPNGFGFTISGQQPCILSCIVVNSPADQAGLRAGDFLISVNGTPVSKSTHDAVVNLIGNSVGPIRMTIAENYYSDSSDEENEMPRLVNSRKPRYLHKPKGHRHKSEANKCNDDFKINSPVKKLSKSNDHPNDRYQQSQSCVSERNSTEPYCEWNANFLNKVNLPQPVANEDKEGVVEYKALVGYLGTIEMPKQLLPNSRLQTVCSCIKKLRQEKRTPTLILMTILPSCLTLKNASNQILAIYPLNRVVYISSTTDKDTRYFGLVTSAVCNNNSTETVNDELVLCKDSAMNKTDVEISNSCHVFLTDPKLGDHCAHLQKADQFKITCTKDVITGNCLEFPRSALYIVSLVQNLYKLQDSVNDRAIMNGHLHPSGRLNDDLLPLVANSPQPSASSNSDSGIGYRDDCGNVSDRILIVEFPVHKKLPLACNINNNNRPSAIDATNICLDILDDPLNNGNTASSHTKSINSIESIRCVNNIEVSMPVNNLAKIINTENQVNETKIDGHFRENMLNNVRALEGGCGQQQFTDDIKAISNIDGAQEIETSEHRFVTDNEYYEEYDCDSTSRFSVRAMPNPKTFSINDLQNHAKCSTECYSERAVDVPLDKKSYESVSLHSVDEELSSVENVSVHSLRTTDKIFKVPDSLYLSNKTYNRNQLKFVGSYDALTSDKYNNSLMKYKLSPKVYTTSKQNYSCEEISKLESFEICSYSSLQNLCSWTNGADVRFDNLDDENGLRKNERPEGPSSWTTSFEKLLEDAVGLQTFAAFLKKEFSAENIYFWTACERYRRNPSVSERAIEAQKIYKRHLCLGAPEPVNVDSQGRQITEQSLQEARCSLFDQAQKQIFNLMKFDSYPRFLKSDLYKQCLTGNADVNFDDGLLINSTSVTPTKLKKSLSNAEDRRRKSLLPWHRKNRSKSKDRGETEYNLKKDPGTSIDQTLSRSEIHNSKTSLLSQESGKFLPDDNSLSCRNPLCRVILNNGSTTVVQIKKEETIHELINRVLEKRGIIYSCYEVFTDKHSKPLDVREPSTTLSGCEVKIEQRVIFKLYLPNRKVIAVKSKYTKILADVLKPILNKYDYKLENVNVTVGKDFVDVYQPVTSVEEKRLIVQQKSGQTLELGQKIDDKPNNIPFLETVTNRVFKDILNEKGDTRYSKPKSDQGSLKSDGWGSENSSSIFGKLLKKDSSEINEKRKKPNASCSKTEQVHNSCEDVSYETNTMIKKPLIAKWRTGAKLHLPSPESDELYEGLKRAQRSRLEDQRGTEINFELPDFLKDKTYDRLDFSSNTKQTSVNTNLHINNNDPFNNSKNNTNNNSNTNKKPNNFRIYSPNKLSPSVSTSPLKCSNEKLTEVSDMEPSSIVSQRLSEPPPLPPKPKIVPAKPSNWGQNGLVKYIQKTDNSNLYLEQPTSSFV